MIDEAEIFTRLTALHSALVEKLGAQPYLGATDMTISARNCLLTLWDKSKSDGGTSDPLWTTTGETIAAVLADAEAFVAAMPGPDTVAKTRWHGKLAEVIDEGHALALPDEVMEPLRTGSKAMHDNLLAAPVAAE